MVLVWHMTLKYFHTMLYALHVFITKFDDKDLLKILDVVKTKNFELIMQQLDTFSVLIQAFWGNPKFRSRVDLASSKLKQSLLSGDVV